MPNKKNNNKTAILQKPPLPASAACKNPAGPNIPKWALPALLIFTAILYSKTLYNGFTLNDDDYYIVNNPFIRDISWHGIKAIFTSFYTANYNPFTTITWAIEYHLFGLDPLPCHLLNVLLHLLNVWLVFKLALRLSGRQTTAIIVALLFALHPMHIESVAWASERKDVLYAAFYLSSLLVYLQYLASGLRTRYYTGTLLLFIAALFSKSAAVTLPVLLVVIDIYKGRKMDARALLEKIPFLLLSLFFGILNIMAQGAGGAINDLTASYGFINRIFLFTAGLAAYFIKLLAPFGLSVIHYLPAQKGGMLPWPYYASLPFLILVAWLVAKRHPYRKEVLFGVSFFLVTISVMLQILAVGSMLIAERYTYISYIGLFYIIGQWASGAWAGRNRNIIAGALSLVVIVFSVQVWQRIDVWKDDNTIVADIVAHNPDIYYGYWMRGNLEKGEGNLQDALQDYSKAISLNPKFDDSYYNRGLIYDRSGNVQAAILDYNKAIEINPKAADTYNNRGWAYFEAGDIKLALRDLSQAILLKPGYAQAYNNRGWAYFKTGDTKAAMADYDKAISADPGYDKPYYNRAALKMSNGDFSGAIEDHNHLLKLHPDDNTVYYYRGLARFNLKDSANACQDWNKASAMGNQMAAQMLQQHCR